MPRDGELPSLWSGAQRVPPANVQAEMALLGALLQNNRALDRCGDLRPEHFAGEGLAEVFSAISSGIQENRVIDALTLGSRFDRRLLVDLLASTVGIINASDYAKVIVKCAALRDLIDALETGVNRAFAHDDPAEIGAEIGSAVDRLSAGTGAIGKLMEVASAGSVERAGAAFKGAKQSQLVTGIRSMDEIWQGLRPGQLYYLMARSRTGKTPAAAQIVRNIAARLLEQAGDGPADHVHFFSLEMTAEDLATINLAATTRWTADQIQSGQIDDWNALGVAQRALGRLPIFIDDEGDTTIGGIRARARAIHRSHRTRLIVVDFMELIGRGQDFARMGLPEWIPTVGYQLKAVAKALNVPVIALRQLNKSRDQAESARPTLSDLPYDGGQAADGVFCLFREELTMGDEPPPMMSGSEEKQRAARDVWLKRRNAARGVTDFGAVKRRFGPSNVWRKLRFDGPHMTLSEIENGTDAMDEMPPDLWERSA